MRRLILSIVLCCLWTPAFAQTTPEGQALMAKTRALYDAPFRRNLVSFDCAVQFDWRQHFVDVLGTVPPAAEPVITQLQTVSHRIFVDRSGPVISAQPKSPDLSAERAADLEKAFMAMIPAGLSAWMPASTNVILPDGPTQFSFLPIDSGYKLQMSGDNVAATLLLTGDLRLTSVVSQLPQPLRATTQFTPGPDGFLLSSVKTAETTDPKPGQEAGFAYTYQTVQGFQIPALITITPATTEAWHYTLSDCKVMTGESITNLPVTPPPPNQ